MSEQKKGITVCNFCGQEYTWTVNPLRNSETYLGKMNIPTSHNGYKSSGDSLCTNARRKDCGYKTIIVGVCPNCGKESMEPIWEYEN